MTYKVPDYYEFCKEIGVVGGLPTTEQYKLMQEKIAEIRKHQKPDGFDEITIDWTK